MTTEEIIKKWKSGLTVQQVSKDYMVDYNRHVKKINETRITKDEAMRYVEPIIFEFETKGWKKR